MKEKEYISVSVIAPLDRELTYSVPPELQAKIQLGQRVAVPLGRRKAVGVVLRGEEKPESLSCKPIEAILDEEPTFSSLQLEFLQWAAQYYLTPLGEMIRTALPSELTRVKKGKGRSQEPALSQVEGSGACPEPSRRVRSQEIEKRTSTIHLTEFQQGIVDKILPPSALSSPLDFSVHLIHGVTGSGKTEIYLTLIERALKKGLQAIALVPEIVLTPQTLQRYTEHFKGQVAAYHSGLSEGKRARIWKACRNGDVSIVIGTRSALFAPFPKLGLIVIDEEQDNSYKQDERTRYHARDLAIVRGKIEKIPVILGSATPSVETYHKAKTGKFFYHELPERYGAAQMPTVEIVDLRILNDESRTSNEKANKSKFSLLSPRLLEEIEANLKRKEQTLIFLNRRGFSHFLLCEDCGHAPPCPNCDITLTYHRRSKKLLCHYCDHQIPPPEACPQCQGIDWRALGSGTERIEEDLQDHFPLARLARMDRDTTSRKGSHDVLLKKLADRETDILVGTQMIAKGHDYPFVTLVGILLADSSLLVPDFRAGEMTYQLMTQVAGRAGRAESPGRVLLQTFSPDHYGIEAASKHRVREFYEEELKAREELGYPPFQRLMVLRIQGTALPKVQRGTHELKKRLEAIQNQKKIEWQILGPSPCLVEKLRNFYRWQILLKCPAGRSLQAILKKEVLETQAEWLPRGLRLIVDVDPVSVV